MDHCKSVEVNQKPCVADAKIKPPSQGTKTKCLAGKNAKDDSRGSEHIEAFIVESNDDINREKMRQEGTVPLKKDQKHAPQKYRKVGIDKRWSSAKDLRLSGKLAKDTEEKHIDKSIQIKCKTEDCKEREKSEQEHCCVGPDQTTNKDTDIKDFKSVNVDINVKLYKGSEKAVSRTPKPVRMLETANTESVEFVNSNLKPGDVNYKNKLRGISGSDAIVNQKDPKGYHYNKVNKETPHSLPIQKERMKNNSAESIEYDKAISKNKAEQSAISNRSESSLKAQNGPIRMRGSILKIKHPDAFSKSSQKHAPKMDNRIYNGNQSNSRNSANQSSTNNSSAALTSNQINVDETSKTGKVVNENGKSKKISDKENAKKTVIYAHLSERMSADADVKAYLTQRIGTKEKIAFSITEISNQNKDAKTKVTIVFSSNRMATKAVHLLHKSNRGTNNKIFCFYMNKDSSDTIEERERNQKAEFDKSARQVVEMAKMALDKHECIIRAAAAKVEETEKCLTTKRGVALDSFNSLLQEKQARDDKLNELKMQRKEFQRFLNCMKDKLTSLKPSEMEKMADIRKSLEIECHKLEAALPMYARREDILQTIKNNIVSVILGETGSGKSTQLVQYLYQAGYADKGLIACTQPRKIAAVSLAKHVSVELASRMGHIVGYQVGMKHSKSKDTRILFMTDHVLLNDCLKDETLSQFSCIIIDEAHERSIYTDLLLGMLKKCLADRPDLKIVITSATIKPDIFVSYFGGAEKCPVLKVSGRTFPVHVFWDDDVYEDPFPEDYERKAVDKAIEVHTTTSVEAGDILVFLTSPTEAEKCCEKFSNRVTGRNSHCLQLHGKLKQDEQQLVFEPSPRGVRKVVFATNSAETSITIPGIKFVIDTGVVKEMRYDAKRKMNCLSVVPVSQSSADQRKGRAGRTAPGVCYRLYSKNDFQSMEKNGKPEILRVNLGQALLKLLQLKVDPLSFDFVESPDKTNMSAVMDNLRQLGAVEGIRLTDLGKWIANLNLEPRLGVIVKNGLELGVPVESMIVATCSSAGSVFYRAGTVEEKKNSDLKKLRFCHPGGDLLTALTVYREWDVVNEKSKGSWSYNNSVNGKTMKGIRESVKEILDILRKEMKIEVKYELCPAGKADKEVQRLLIKCMMSNLCYYLGHERAGYITTDLLQHVQMHPSSSLVCLGQQPKWIVYEQILKTTDDFVTNITPVSEDDVEGYIFQGNRSLDKEYLETRVVSQVCKVSVGKYAFWKFVGPQHKGRREMEETISSVCNGTLIVIEADKQKGEIMLFTVRQFVQVAEKLLKDALCTSPEVLKNEGREMPLGSEKSGVRAVLGHGCCVVDILLPFEYRSLNIKQKELFGIELNEEEVRMMFSTFGPIDQIWKAKGKKKTEFWGKVTFLREKDAAAAADEFNSDEDALIEIVPIKYSTGSKSSSEFTVRFSWCRRLGRGIAYIYLDCPQDEIRLLSKSSITVGEKRVEVLRARRGSNLMLRGLSAYVTEDEIKEALADTLNVTFSKNSSRFGVVIPREQSSISGTLMDAAYRQLATLIASITPARNFRINLKEVKEQTARFTAFVSFTNPGDCESVMEDFTENTHRINGAPVDASMDLKTSIVVQRAVFEVVKVDLDMLTQHMRRKSSSTEFKRRELKSGNIVVDINSTSPRKLAKAKKYVHDIVDGESLDSKGNCNLSHLFARNSRQVMGDIEKSTQTLIRLDERTLSVTVYGSTVSRQTAVQELKLFLQSISDATEEIEVALKGDDSPPGVMKELIIQYGTDLKGLKEAADLAGVSLNYRLHKVTMTGNEETIAKGCELIQIVKDKLSVNKTCKDTEMPDCSICMCPIDLSQMYRLEYCGHAYCKECFKNMTVNAINEKKFPIECAAEGCGKDIVIRDINIQLKQGAFTSSALVAAAVDCLVAKNGSSYHYCLTPNCEIVYKITSSGKLFKCPVCSCRICTSCNTQYHDGMSCAVYSSVQKQDDSVKEWIREDPSKRKLCPKCDVRIEKIEGCNHVTCYKCKAHICWVCLEFFSESGQCYGHLSTKHGSWGL